MGLFWGFALREGGIENVVSLSSWMNQMKRILLVLLVCFAGWKYWPEIQARINPDPPALATSIPTTVLTPVKRQPFHCDGRKYCSQMTSCEEATQFLRNCPGMKMDGNGDGVPCESQWCR